MLSYPCTENILQNITYTFNLEITKLIILYRNLLHQKLKLLMNIISNCLH